MGGLIFLGPPSYPPALLDFAHVKCTITAENLEVNLVLRKKEDEKYFKIAVTGVAILLIGMVCFFLFYRIRGFGAFFMI